MLDTKLTAMLKGFLIACILCAFCAISPAQAVEKMDINTATAAQLETLPSIGPAIAGRIIDYRKNHGLFTSVDEITNVKGIGEKKLAKLKPLIMVGKTESSKKSDQKETKN